MTWRSVIVSRPARLRRQHFSLVVEQEQTAFVPFEDLAVIVLDHPEILLTEPVLGACSEHGVALFTTDRSHQPSGVFLPFLTHSRTTRVLRLQLGLSRPRAKQAHAAIVRAKIGNQIACLEQATGSHDERLASYRRRIRSGDTDNLEAQASAHYFPQLFGKGFRRSAPTLSNSALNYGYAILRGAVARALVAHGLHPTVGLFHANEQNAFNLADDLLEPLRPLVDLLVHQQIEADGSIEGELAREHKSQLVSLLHHDLRMPRGDMTTLATVDQMTESLVRWLEGGENDGLELPELRGLVVVPTDG